MTEFLGSIRTNVKALPEIEVPFLVPLGITDVTEAGRIGYGATSSQLIFQIYGPKRQLLAIDLHDLARSIGARLATEVTHYSPAEGR